MEHYADRWRLFHWYCPNCGRKVSGYKNERGIIKAECVSCKVRQVRTLKGRRGDLIELFSPMDR